MREPFIRPVNLPWDRFTDLQQDAARYLVANSLQVLLADLDRWLPTALEKNDAGKLALTLLWDLDDVDASIVKLREEASVQEQRQLHDLRRIVQRHEP